MKYIKTFESVDEPQVGDYVICDEEQLSDKDVTDFVNSHIGIIFKTLNNGRFPNEYVVKFKDVPESLVMKYSFDYGDTYMLNARKIYRHEIKCWARTKEELEHKIAANKYNL